MEVTGFSPYVSKNPEGVENGGTITNEERSAVLKILKQDKDDSSVKLEGVTFELSRIVDEVPTANDVMQDGPVLESKNTGADGTLTFTGLTAGCYAIKEGARPAGYISTETDVFYIRVDGSGVHIIQKDMTKAPSDWQIVTSYPHNDLVAAFAPAAGEEPAAVTVVNQKGAALPSTGGTGMLYLFGIILTGLAGAGLVMKKRRRNAA